MTRAPDLETARKLAEATGFALRTPPGWAGLLHRPGLAAQVIPQAAELAAPAVGLTDPIGDGAFAPVPGLTHRYADRVILHLTRVCDLHCRFCFRRAVVGESGPLPEADLTRALDYIAARPRIREVILTGGDPLTLSSRRIAAVLERLGALDLDLIRIHSRVPVVAPDRIADELLSALASVPALWFVLHTNHPDELTPEACAAISRLTAAGIPMLSQSVLLKGVNADPDTLETLFRRLLRLKVKPYYLHHCDLVQGAEHFRTSIPEGQAIMAILRQRLTGIGLPTYVLDLPGGHGKVPIGPGHLEAAGPGQWRLRDREGHWHEYADPTPVPAAD